MDGAVQGLQEVAGQVVGTRHSLLETRSLGYLHRLLHVAACTSSKTSQLDLRS